MTHFDALILIGGVYLIAGGVYLIAGLLIGRFMGGR